MRTNHCLSQRQRGQAIVLVALMALVLVAFVGLALDGGQIYSWRRGMQNAADAGAIAGAYTMTLGANNAQIGAAVQQYSVVANRADIYAYTVQASCVTVSTTKNFPSLFVGLIGINELNAKAQATACAGQPTGVNELWPLAISVFSYTISSTFPLSITNLNWLCFDTSCGASEMTDWIKNGFTGIYAQYPDAGSSICTGANPNISELIPPACLAEKPGQNAALGQLYDPICTPPNNALGRDFTVPLFDVCADRTSGVATACQTGGSSSNNYHIVGFGRFSLQGIRLGPGNGSQNGCMVGVANHNNLPDCPGSSHGCIWGFFKKYVDYHDICVSGCSSYTGILSVILTN
jgi:Flp pilus assembly protein TadG